jgi:putative sigma-54 modulation protein
MHISIHVNAPDANKALNSYIDRRLRYALGRYGSRVGSITVNIGGKGPMQVRCRLAAEVLPSGRVAVEEKDADLFTAIDRATGRIGRLFGRELERIRQARVSRESVQFAA